MTTGFVPRDRLQRLDTQSPLRAEDTFFEQCWYEDDPEDLPQEVAASSMAATAAMAIGLRPFAEVAQAVLEVTSDPNVDLDDLCRLIECDPALASKMIRLANSPHLRRKTRCRNLRQAVQRLGFRMVRGLALSVATLDTFADPWGEGRRIREHSAGTAAVLRVLTSAYDRRLTHEAYLCGLLHDFGKLLIQQVGELDYETFRRETARSRYEKHVEERRILGYDHAILGGWVLRRWDIPTPVPTAVALHHRIEASYADDGPLGRLIAWLACANELEKHLADGAVADLAYFEWYARRPAFARVGLTAQKIAHQWEAMHRERAHTLEVFHT